MTVDVVVNAASQSLLGGGGADGESHVAAGTGLTAKCRSIACCQAGDARATAGHPVAVRYVDHTVGPVWIGGMRGTEDGLLVSCICACLPEAVEQEAGTLAFRVISCGADGHPAGPAAVITVSATAHHLRRHERPEWVMPGCRAAVPAFGDDESDPLVRNVD